MRIPIPDEKPEAMATLADQFCQVMTENDCVRWRTVAQYATELGGVLVPFQDSFRFPDGSLANVVELHSGKRYHAYPRDDVP
jgi:hypothetical protein